MNFNFVFPRIDKGTIILIGAMMVCCSPLLAFLTVLPHAIIPMKDNTIILLVPILGILICMYGVSRVRMFTGKLLLVKICLLVFGAVALWTVAAPLLDLVHVHIPRFWWMK